MNVAAINLAPSDEAPGNSSLWLSELTGNSTLRWQHGDTNMGLVLAPLLEANGWQGDIYALCDALPTAARVVTLRDVLAVMGSLGYRIRRERTHSSQIRPEELPALFVPDRPSKTQAHHWCEAMVLRERGPYGLIWEDGRESHRGELPVSGGSLYRFERIVSDVMRDETPVGSQPKTWTSMVRDRFVPLFWHAAGLSLLMNLFTLAMPLFSMAVYDRVIAAHAPGTLPLLAVGVISAILMETMIRWIRVRLAGWMGARSGVLVSGAMFERLLFLPASAIEQASISAQLARLRAFESVRDFVTGPMFLSLLEIPFLSVLILVIALLAGPVAWISVAILCVNAIMLLTLRPSWQRLSREAAHTAAQRQQLLMESIEQVKQLYASGVSDRLTQRFKIISWQAAKAQYHFGMTASLVQHIAGLLTVLAGLATIAWSLNRIWEGQMTGGAMVATMIITWRVLYPLQALCTILPHLEQIRGSLDQVSALMKLVPEAHAARTVLAEHPLKGQISIQNLGLRYNRKSDPVFMGLSAEIRVGQIVAIYGGNGSGKSSILRMLLGLYPPVMGNIRLDGVDHRQFDPRGLRRQIAYLPQNPELIPGTVADNLRVMDPLAPEFRLRQALLWADAWELVEQLPAGLETVLGEGGVIPSSGLSARLTLARLYLANRPLVLCDELPAQLLNSSTGERFRRYLEECRGKRTVLFVTHRDDWLQMADQVIWFRPDGRAVVGRPEPQIDSEI